MLGDRWISPSVNKTRGLLVCVADLARNIHLGFNPIQLKMIVFDIIKHSPYHKKIAVLSPPYAEMQPNTLVGLATTLTLKPPVSRSDIKSSNSF